MRTRVVKALRELVFCVLALPLAAALAACAPQAWEPPPGTMQSGWRGSSMIGINMLVSGYTWDGGASDAAAPMDVDEGVPHFEVEGAETVRVYFSQAAADVAVARYSADAEEGEPVAVSGITSDGVTLEVEPGWRYAVSAQFEGGSADYLIDVVSGGSAQEEFTSTAMVVLLGNGRPLFVDRQTGSPYYPTLPADAPELASGNVVRVTGNGIMLESYPGQYPGITKVEVIEEGSPEDAEKYAELAAQLWQPKDPSEPAIATLEYRTEEASVSLLPLANAWTWSYELNGETVTVSNDAPAANQIDATDLPEATAGEAVEVTMTFDLPPVESDDSRWPEVVRYPESNLETGAEAVDAALSGGALEFSVEPGWRYRVDVAFDAGQVSYVFTVR